MCKPAAGLGFTGLLNLAGRRRWNPSQGHACVLGRTNIYLLGGSGQSVHDSDGITRQLFGLRGKAPEIHVGMLRKFGRPTR